MQHLRAPWRRLPIGLCAALVLLVLMGCDSATYPQSTLDPRSEYTAEIDHLFRITVWLALIVFVIVEGALLYAIFKFRGKPEDADPEQSHGNTMVELIWTIVPAVVLAIVAVPTVQTILKTAEIPTTSPDGQPPLKVEVTGHQWWWEIHYPDLGITTGGEWHVPVNRSIDLRMKSADVIHSFWMPQVGGKRDVFPNRETRLAFAPTATGEFPGACAEFCGLQHARMDHYLMVDEPAAFDAWVAARKADSLTVPPLTVPSDSVMATWDPVRRQGETLFREKGCVGCHSFSATKPMKGLQGPNLSGIGTRKMIAGGWLPNTDENLAKWIQNPHQFKSGVKMRNKPETDPVITDAEAQALVAYLRTKR